MFFQTRGGRCLRFWGGLGKKHWWLVRHPLPVGSSHEAEVIFRFLPRFRPEGWHWTFPIYLLLIFSGIALITIPISRNITGPLRRLTEAVRRIRQGDLHCEVPQRGHDEVAELAEAVEEMRSTMLRSDELRRELFSDISHEIRTPLARIRTVAESVEDGLMREEDELQDAMGGVCRQVDEVSGLLSDLLEVARLEVSGDERLQKTEISLPELLRDQVSATAPSAKAQGICLEIDTIEDSVSTLSADPARLRQVLNNLLQNAFRHSPEGGLVTVSAYSEADFVRVEVADQGPGVPEEEREKIFERLYRTDRSRSRSTGGQGIGLSVTSRIIAAHGGTIDVTDAPSSGALFRFWLPL